MCRRCSTNFRSNFRIHFSVRFVELWTVGHSYWFDCDGIALPAIQRLLAELDERDERIADLESRLAAVEDQLGDEDSQ
jgi:NADPH-dependent ferric siderophore reductase